MSAGEKFWAVVPAAGIGTRMQSDTPKQYLRIGGRCILDYVLDSFCEHPRIAGVMVALAPHDDWWAKLERAGHAKVMQAPGGVERCHSVLNALHALEERAAAGDWVLVHDAARPCLDGGDIDRLIESVVELGQGGILATPVRDTMKRSDATNTISETVERAGLWHALTPQMFRLGELATAIESALADKILVTDEAQAMELTGKKPLLVEGDPGNIKVTLPRDLKLAEIFLLEREEKQ